MAEDTPESEAIPLVWVGVEDVPVLAANQAIIQHSGEGEFLLTFGQLSPPVLLGTQDEVVEQAKRLSYVAIRPVARIAFNRQRLQEVIRILQEHLAKHDAQFAGGGAEHA